MEVSISRGSVRRSRNSGDEDVTISGAGKRRKLGSEDEENVIQLQYRSERDVDVNFNENVASTPSINSISDESDLKAVCVSVSETAIFKSDNDGFSREIETSASSVVCFESEEMESSSTSRFQTKNPETETTIEASSRRKPPQPAVTMPSAAELEEFFSKAEKYEQKRFAEKYNFDIVKDVPMEGRFQWLPLKP